MNARRGTGFLVPTFEDSAVVIVVVIGFFHRRDTERIDARILQKARQESAVVGLSKGENLSAGSIERLTDAVHANSPLFDGRGFSLATNAAAQGPRESSAPFGHTRFRKPSFPG